MEAEAGAPSRANKRPRSDESTPEPGATTNGKETQLSRPPAKRLKVEPESDSFETSQKLASFGPQISEATAPPSSEVSGTISSQAPTDSKDAGEEGEDDDDDFLARELANDDGKDESTDEEEAAA